MATTKKNIKGLLLFSLDKKRVTLSYNYDWVDAFQKFSKIELDSYNIAEQNSWIHFLPRIRKYDVIIILHSTNLTLKEVLHNNKWIRYAFYSAFKFRKGKVVFFVYNEFKEIPLKIQFIKNLQADFVVSQFPQDIAGWLYAECATNVISLPHALNESIFYPETNLQSRPIDIGGRSYDYPWFLGDRDRYNMFQFFSNLKSECLVLDLSQDPRQRFERTGWAHFLNSCKGTIGTEAGTSYLEKDGHTRHAVMDYLKQHPSATFEEIYQKFFAKYKNPVLGKIISSRHFDAIGTKTCQIMFPGRFNDILIADEHYIALKRDFSNIQDVLERFKDVTYRQNMVDRTYEYVLDCHTHKHRIKMLMEYVLK